MARLQALVIVSWLLIAICATQLVYCMLGLRSVEAKSKDAWNKLFNDDIEMSPEETWKTLDKIDDYKEMLDVDLGNGLSVRMARFYGEFKRYSCYMYYMADFYKHYREADKQNSKSLRNYLIKKFEERMDQCEANYIRGIRTFQEKEPDDFRHLKEFFDAIKSNGELYAELQKDGTELNEQMMTVLGDVSKRKTPDVEDDYASKAILRLRKVCRSLTDYCDKDAGMDSVDLIRNISKGVKRQGELPEQIVYLDLCEKAEEAKLPLEVQIEKLDKQFNARIAELKKEFDPQYAKARRELTRLRDWLH